MRYFKTPENTVRAIDVGQEFLIQDDWVEMTDAEIELYINPPLAQEQLDEIAFNEWKAVKKAEEEAALRAEFEAQRN